MNRRTFLKRSLGYGLGVGAAVALGRFSLPSYASAANVSGDLEPQATPLQLHPSLDATTVWSFAAGASPVLRYKQGEQLSLRVANKLDESVGVHWHGLRVPNAMDGVPGVTQASVLSGETFDYDFLLEDAGTYWYHTHSNSQEQLGRGLAGALIVEEKRPPDVDEDLVLLLQDWRLNNGAQVENDFYNGHDLAHSGRLGNAVSVNAEIQPNFTVRPGSRLRLRFINASTARLYRPTLPEGWTAWLVALDGQPVPVTPYEATLLAPGMRADLIVDVPAQPRVTVSDTAYEPYPLFTFEASGEGRSARTTVPEALEPNPIALPTNAAERLDLVLEGGAMSSMMSGMMGRGVWFLNGGALKEGDNPTPLFVLEQGRSYRIAITNKTAFPHPMHLHGHTFQVLSQNGKALAQPRLSDTALLLPEARTDIAFVADNPGDWMLHCHVLGHQAGGMMALVKVV